MPRPLLVVAVVLASLSQAVAEDLTVLPNEIGGGAPAEMMHEYLMGLVEAALDRRDTEYEKIKTPQDVVAHQKGMRQFYVDQLGGFPERTPLNAKVVEKRDGDGCRIEKVVYESQPRLFVTALLYLPKTEPPYPGVLVPCGHSGNGKASEAYQSVCILLAKNGLAALCYDPIEQGERYQLLDEKGKPLAGGTTGHSIVGVGSTLLGRNTATYRIWDGMRSIDYLQDRPDIDPKLIGCTGNSGGGTLTSYLMALDERIACAAPSCFLTSTRRLLEVCGPQDAEQNIHAQVSGGMTHADYVLMRAPKPTLMCTATHDFFPIDGSWATFREAKRIYGRLGFAERVDLIETDARHGFSTQLRVGTVRWMRRWLLKIDDAITETEPTILTDEEALCTPRGQVMLIEGARTTYDINNDLEEQLSAVRKKFWQTTDKQKALAEVRRITGIRNLVELPKPPCEKVGELKRDGYRIEKLILRPEPGIWLPALAFLPDKPNGDACLYLHDKGKEVDADAGGPIDKLARQGNIVLAVDLRGFGETAKSREQSKSGLAGHIGPEWKGLYLAYMLEKPYLAMRAEDVMVCARFLAQYNAAGKPNRVHLVSVGRVGPVALHAVALEPQLFASAKLQNSLVAWASLLETPLAKSQFINVVHGVLRTYDLPDLLATLPADKLTVVDPVEKLE
jgi:dienelactone hydrolase